MKIFGNVVNVYRALIKSHLTSGMTVMDATCGNGYDTRFLCDIVGNDGYIFAMDLQAEAIEATASRCMTDGSLPDNIELIHDSHERMDHYVQPETLDAAVFNLGYLPGGNKAVTTDAASTSSAVLKALACLKHGGLLYILCYVGHSEGVLEYEMLTEMLHMIPQSEADVMTVAFANQSGKPPVMCVVEKK
jgi:predicted methyltransferase